MCRHVKNSPKNFGPSQKRSLDDNMMKNLIKQSQQRKKLIERTSKGLGEGTRRAIKRKATKFHWQKKIM